MKLHFHEPPEAQKIGGLDAAIRSMQHAMEKLDHTIEVNPSAGDADAAHFHGMWQPGFPSLSRQYRALGVPCVVSPHGMLEPWACMHKRWKKLPYWHLIEKRWARRASCILATAKTEADRLLRFFPQTRIAALPLGLTGDARPDYAAARAKLGWDDDETVLLFLSRIHKKKGLDLLFSALATLPLPGRTRLVIVGPEEQPAYAARCRDFTKQNATRLPKVEWRGAIWGEDRWAYLQGADLFCLPTHSENFGLAVLEACQCGTAVLTTTATPWAGALAQRGFICEPHVASIRTALSTFFERRPTPDQRVSLSGWAFANYDWSVLAPRYAELYASL